MMRFFALVAVPALAFAISATPVAAQPAIGPVTGGPAVVAPPAVFDPSGETGVSRPRFIVEATSFKALNETGWDFLGSDEVVARFLANNQSMFTGIYGDVDTGETHPFRSLQQCISPAIDPDNSYNHSWQCNPAGASGAINFAIEFFEYDGFLRGVLTEPLRFCLEYAPNDLTIVCDRRLQSLVIGRGQASYTAAQLAAAMPGAGSFITRTIPVGSRYQVDVRITRTNDSTIAPPEVVVPTPVPTISLQATVDYEGNGPRIILTWTGATTSDVDIYRDGSLYANPQNNGSLGRTITPGTYVFRLCNEGSTTACSSDVTVTVNP